VPTAAEIPEVAIHHLETPCAFTRARKGVGEGGTIGAPAAVLQRRSTTPCAAPGVELDDTPYPASRCTGIGGDPGRGPGEAAGVTECVRVPPRETV